MHWSKEAIIDTMLIVGGTGSSVLFISTDGNGQNPMPVLGSMLIVVLVAAVVSFSIAKPVRTVALAVPASALVTDMLFVLFFLSRVAFAATVHEHAGEEAFLLPMVFVVVTAPTVLLSSVGFGRMAQRLYGRRRARGEDDDRTDKAQDERTPTDQECETGQGA